MARDDRRKEREERRKEREEKRRKKRTARIISSVKKNLKKK
jgi:hypothetical protein